MALPALLRKLFKSSGYGSELNDGIISKIISNQDWSNSYDYPVGVVARGSDDVLYYSVAQSGPGTSAGAKDPAQSGNSGFWKSVGSGDSVPTGTVLWLSTTTVPAGYLLCNGSAVGRATYPELFAAIGTTYGAGDGSTTFNLPNLIDKFAEGSAVAGTVKAAGLPNITGYDKIAWYGVHDGAVNNDPASNARSGCFDTARINGTGNFGGGGVAGSDNVPRGVAFDASKSNSIYGKSSTVQPPALTLLPCIKAFSSVVGDATIIAGQLVNDIQRLANDIQSKVDLDGSNLSGAAFRVVVETWHSGASWYRVWSDGWIEQGGIIASTAANAKQTITLHKNYSNTNFSVLFTYISTDANATAGSTAIGVHDKTTTSFKCVTHSTYYSNIQWIACGY